MLAIFTLLILSGCKKAKFVPCFKMVNCESKIKKVTIWVHGTKTITELIPKIFFVPSGLNKTEIIDSTYYIKEMHSILCNVSPCDFNFDDFYAFGWSGGLGYNYRLIAAQDLYLAIQKLISEYNDKGFEVELTIITHSHGGNVALNLANIHNEIQNSKEKINFKVDRLILLACPIQDQTHSLIHDNIFKKVYSIYSKADMLQVVDPQGLYKENKNKNVSLFSNRRFKHCDKLKQVKIKINGRAIMHSEFLSRRFLKILPGLLKIMDDITCDDNEHLVKMEYKNESIKNTVIKVCRKS